MNNNVIINILTDFFPTMNAGLAAMISYVLVFAIGLLVGIPTVTLYVRKYIPHVIEFLTFVYEQTAKAEKLRVTDKNNVSVPLPGVEKKEVAYLAVNKALHDPNNTTVTDKAIKAYQNITGKNGDISSVIDAVVPVMKATKHK